MDLAGKLAGALESIAVDPRKWNPNRFQLIVSIESHDLLRHGIARA
jgi:hypothetical protein